MPLDVDLGFDIVMPIFITGYLQLSFFKAYGVVFVDGALK